MFALNSASVLESSTGDGAGSNGVFVKVTNGNLNQETITYGSDAYLGDTDYPFVGGDMYPTNPLEISPAASGETPLGLTLNQTAKTDENGEKLLYNVTKKEELQAILPGQSVPVATRGVFTLSKNAIEGGAASVFTIGGGFEVAGAGTVGPATAGAAGSLGTILGTGSRASQGGLTDQFAGDYVVVKLG
tara:strand:- start:23006 stop:23572 length:567 start_codon:yes stop_codon:yes gene_type:complete